MLSFPTDINVYYSKIKLNIMNKWGTKVEFAYVIISVTFLLDYFAENKYILIIGGIGGGALLLSSFYDSWKNKQKKK